MIKKREDFSSRFFYLIRERINSDLANTLGNLVNRTVLQYLFEI